MNVEIVRNRWVVSGTAALLALASACSGDDPDPASPGTGVTDISSPTVPSVSPSEVTRSRPPKDKAPGDSVDAEESAVELVTEFLDAYFAYDADRALDYLSDEAVASMIGTREDFRLDAEQREAWRYVVRLTHPCEVSDSSPERTIVRCTTEIDAFGSDALGLGPFEDRVDLTVRDGTIVAVTANGTSDQSISDAAWDPFEAWARAEHPEDAEVLFGNAYWHTEESFQTWRQRLTEYIDEQVGALGMFAPIRGWIVYPHGGNLHAVDPADPARQRRIELPDSARGAQPAGWSSDGTRLALNHEDADARYVIDASGGIVATLRDPGGCCTPTTNAWLSPDGRLAAYGLNFVEVDDPSSVEQTYAWDDPGALPPESELHRNVELRPGIGDLADGAWAPDGTRVAVAVSQARGTTIRIVDLATADTLQVFGPWNGSIHQWAWSPDGRRLVVTASGPSAPHNRMIRAVEADLYVIDLATADVDEIASGQFVLATWSPDGSQIAAINGFGPYDLVVMDADGTRKHLLAGIHPSGPFTGIAWHPGERA